MEGSTSGQNRVAKTTTSQEDRSFLGVELSLKKERKETKSKPKTIIKNSVRKDYMISHKFREFRVDRVLSGAV